MVTQKVSGGHLNPAVSFAVLVGRKRFDKVGVFGVSFFA